MAVEFVADLIAGVFDLMALAIEPWRFLFSSEYRRKKQEQWRTHPLRMVFEIILGIVCLLVGTGVLALLVWLALGAPGLS